MKNLLSLTLALSFAAFASGVGAQTQPSTSLPAAPVRTPGAPGEAVSETLATIDCPPTALSRVEETTPSASPVGTPSGSGTGSGAQALPGHGPVQRVEGTISQIDSSRTSRAVEVGDVKIWIEPSTAILLDCQKAAMTDLEKGTSIKAVYEQKGGRNVAKIIEAKK
jgi:hypothetical protein